MSDVLLINNPKSRAGRRKISAVRGWLAMDSRGLEVSEIALVDFVGQASAVPDDVRVVVVGGDGTVNGALATLRRLGCRATVGIVPAGTGNNLAEGLGIPVPKTKREDLAHVEAACEIAFRSPHTRGIDVLPYGVPGEPKKHIVAQSGALGFPARVTGRYDRWRRFPPYRWLSAPLRTVNYRLLALLGIFGQKWRDLVGDELRLACRFRSADGDRDVELDENVLAIFVHNEPTIGGDFTPCPRACVDDGLVDICLIRARSGVGYLKLFHAVGPGEHITREGMREAVEYEQSAGPVHLEFSKPTPFVSDGDIWLTEREYEIEVEPRRFEIAVPEGFESKSND